MRVGAWKRKAPHSGRPALEVERSVAASRRGYPGAKRYMDAKRGAESTAFRNMIKQGTERVSVATRRGLTDITQQVRGIVRTLGLRHGLCTVFIRHTSASLVIQENADPAVLTDLEAFLARLVPEGDRLYTHRAEGDDDMPAHVRSALTRTSEQVPILDGELALGTWQALYVWEHRRGHRRRELLVHVIGE